MKSSVSTKSKAADRKEKSERERESERKKSIKMSEPGDAFHVCGG